MMVYNNKFWWDWIKDRINTKLVLEKNMKVWKDRSIHGWQVIRKAHLSFQLKWTSELKTILLFHKPLSLSFITLKCGAWSSNSLLIITHLICPMPSSRRKILQQIKHFHYTTDSRSVPKFCGQLSIVTDEIKHWAHQKQTISNKKCKLFKFYYFFLPKTSIFN